MSAPMMSALSAVTGMTRALPKPSTRPLLAGLLTMLLLMCVGMGLGIYQLRHMAATLDEVVLVDDAARKVVNTMLRATRSRTLTLMEAINTADAFERDEKLLKFDRMAKGFREARQHLFELSQSDEERAALAQQGSLMTGLLGHLEYIVNLARQGELATAQSIIYSQAIPAQSKMLDALLLWVEAHDDYHDKQVKQLQKQQRQVVGMMIGVTLVSILVGLLITRWVTHWNSRVIARFTEDEAHLRSTLDELTLRQQAMDAHSIVSVADASGNITHVNDKFCEVSGYSLDELIGANHRIVKSGFHPDAFYQDMWDTINHGCIWQGKVKNRAKNGQYHWMETTIVPLLDESGLPVRYISVRTEITKIMEMEEAVRQANVILESNIIERTHQLEQAKQQLEQELFDRVRTQAALQKSYDELKTLHRQLQETQQYLMQSEKLAAVGQLAAGMAHEINNPIGFVASNLGTLSRYQETLSSLLARYRQLEAGLDEAARTGIAAQRQAADLDFLLEDSQALLRESRDGMERVRKIVQDLRDFSRVDSAKEWQWLDLNHSMDTTLALLGERLTEGVSIRREYGALPEVECHSADLNQVFLNLLNNALQAVHGNGNITLRSGLEGEQAWVEIEDSGEGIADDVLPRIFDPFFTTRPVGQGAGLGLSMAYGIIQKHGGQISVRSQLGTGSVFRVTLPLQQKEGAASGGEETPAAKQEVSAD